MRKSTPRNKHAVSVLLTTISIFNSSLLDLATVGIFDPEISPDYPTTLTFGPKYFESYHTFPDVNFVHGYNLGRNSSAARNALIESVPYACKALRDGKLLYWELGNEPDLYSTSAQGAVRPPNWNERCYIDGADEPGVTLQGTLMNHSSNVASIALQLNESRLLSGLPYNINPDLPFILGETNSLYNQGRPGLSNTFGAALWGVDFNLWCATNNIRRVHMHQGTNYRYQAWQPIDTNKVAKGTKAPYYGSIAVASFLGDIVTATPSITNLPLPDEQESAYAAYVDGKLDRIIVINMMEYNATAGNRYINHYPRPIEQYRFQLPEGCHGEAEVQRLMANGSDAITGVSFDGYSYNWELDNGMAVLLHNVTRGETVTVSKGGEMSIDVPRSSAVIIRLNHGRRP
ncbi:hypothetical protein LTR37_004758 [Vermiconidia calcicola]|uniref:Uncharacterized protein n=1 Tax=Vermiconidia calcicola TaxID=1690605 RepID=A0ACC3NLL0_9PEZI|nr:hypothetical protein LTR37_004758 [Vermiconidia calcicola]